MLVLQLKVEGSVVYVVLFNKSTCVNEVIYSAGSESFLYNCQTQLLVPVRTSDVTFDPIPSRTFRQES